MRFPPNVVNNEQLNCSKSVKNVEITNKLYQELQLPKYVDSKALLMLCVGILIRQKPHSKSIHLKVVPLY